MADGGHSVAPRAHQLSPPPALVAPASASGSCFPAVSGVGLGAGAEPRLNQCALLAHGVDHHHQAAFDEAARSRPLPLPPGNGSGGGGDDERPFERGGTGGTNSARSSKKKLISTLRRTPELEDRALGGI